MTTQSPVVDTIQTARSATPRARAVAAARRLPRPLRNTVLFLHIGSGIGWMGVDIALVALLLTAGRSDDPNVVAAGFNAIAIIVPAAVPVLSLGMLLTGIALGLGTPWGLVRNWWVLIKFALSIVLTALVFLVLVPGIGQLSVLAAGGASADGLRASMGPAVSGLYFPPIVSFMMLAFASALSIVKPWRLTPWARSLTAGVLRYF